MLKKLPLICLLSFSCCFAMDNALSSSTGNELQKITTLEDLPGPNDVESGTQENNLRRRLNAGAPEGTKLRKYIDREIEKEEGVLHRTFSQEDLSTLTAAVLAAAPLLEARGNKHKKRVTKYKWVAAAGTGCGSCLGAMMAAIVTALWTHFHTKSDC